LRSIAEAVQVSLQAAPLLTAVLLVGSASLARGAPSGPACANLPMPEPRLALAPVPLGMTRPALPVPGPPPAPREALENGPVPLPGFTTAAVKPLPEARDPGALSCAFTAFRAGEAIVDCGIHRALQQDFSAARRALEQSVTVDPRGARAPTATLWLGEIALREGRRDEAEQAYRTVLSRGVQDDAARDAALGLTWARMERGDWAAALAALDPVRSADPASSVVRLGRFLEGVGLLLGDRPGEALVALDSADAGPLPEALRQELPFWRGVAQARLGELERALETLERFVADVPPRHPLRADGLAQAGWIALERGAADRAARLFLQATSVGARAELRPHVEAGLYRAYRARGETARASEVMARLIAESRRDPLGIPTLLSVAGAAMRSGATADGEAAYRHILRLPAASPVEDYARYRLGEALEKSGRLGEARAEYVRLREAGRDEAIAQRAVYRLGLLALHAGDPADARREGEALLRAGTLVELREGVLLLAAEGAARDGDAGRAGELLAAALGAAPDSPRADRVRLALGWAHLDQGDPEQALAEWRQVVQADAPDTKTLARLAIAEIAMREGRESLALDALRSVGGLSGPPSLVQAVALDRGILAARAGADDEAARALEPLVPSLGDPSRQALARRALGLARYRATQYEAAEQDFRQATQLMPDDPLGWLGAGLSALAQRRLVEAGEAFARAQARADAATAASAAYGLLLVALQRGDEAAFREQATAFVDARPAHDATPGLLCALAAGAIAQGDVERAEEWVTRLVRDHARSEYAGEALGQFAAAAVARPGLRRRVYGEVLASPVPDGLRLDALVGLADTELALGDPAAAQRAAEGFLREAPAGDARIPAASVLVLRSHAAQGRHGLTLRSAESFLARFPDDPLAPFVELVRGRLLVSEGRWEAAQPALEAARARGAPQVAAEAQFWLGETLRARGDLDGAIAAYLEASRRYPETMWAARGLQGAARSYLARSRPAEAVALLREITVQPAAEPALVDWAHDGLRRLGAEPVPDARDRLPKVPAVRP
jgi:TolA-binding protein